MNLCAALPRSGRSSPSRSRGADDTESPLRSPPGRSTRSGRGARRDRDGRVFEFRYCAAGGLPLPQRPVPASPPGSLAVTTGSCFGPPSECLPGNHRNVETPIPADHPSLERVPKEPANQHSMHVVYRSYGALIERDNEVSLAQPGDRGWAVGLDGNDLHRLRWRQRMAPRDEAVDRPGLPDDAKVSAADTAVSEQLAYHPLG